MARVVIAGGGRLGTALAERLKAQHEVRIAAAELTSIPSTEVQLAGAQTIVHLSRVNAPVAQLPRASVDDLDALISDTVSRAAKRVGATRLIHFASSADDRRVAIFERSGVPLSVLRGGGPEPLEHLVELVNTNEGNREGTAWAPAEREPKPRFTTCSIQRYTRPAGWKAIDLARAYFTWLPTDVPLVKTSEQSGVFTVTVAGLRSLVLRHVAGRSDDDSAWLEVAGGALRSGDDLPVDARFEFRCLLDGTAMAALIDFAPSLPFFLYRFTQAVVHERVMRRFGTWLESQK